MTKTFVHERYVIVVGDFGVTLYSENKQGQWNATGISPKPFSSVIEAAEYQRTLPNAQTQLQVINHLSPAVWLGANANQIPSWHSCSSASLDTAFRSSSVNA